MRDERALSLLSLLLGLVNAGKAHHCGNRQGSGITMACVNEVTVSHYSQWPYFFLADFESNNSSLHTIMYL